jgi:predicted phosphoribosyltransferase
MRFRDRTRAGQLLAKKLSHYANRKDVAVVALPPGGVLVGYEIAYRYGNTLKPAAPRPFIVESWL